MIKPFIQTLEQIAPLSDGLKKAFKKGFKKVEIKKGQILLSEGEVCSNAYFMVNGLARLYYLIKGKEVTNRFILPKSVAISYYSFFSQKPSFEYIDVLSDSRALVISKQEMDKIYLDFPELHKIMQGMLQQSHIESEERAMILRKLSAKEKYSIMRSKFPEVFNSASTEQIATFLGVTRETLSRIRSGK